MNRRERVLAAIRHEEPDFVPYNFHATGAVYESQIRAGRLTHGTSRFLSIHDNYSGHIAHFVRYSDRFILLFFH